MLIDPSLPENALANVRGEVHLFFGNQENLIPETIDMLIDWAVKRLHRKWHTRRALLYTDTTIPVAGTKNVPADYKKLFQITSQTWDTDDKITYKSGVDYDLWYNNESKTWQIIWRDAPSTALSVRIIYYRKPTRANEDSDLVDIEEDTVDLIKKICRLEYCALKGNKDEYVMLKQEVTQEIQDYIDDDTFPDMTDEMRPLTSDRVTVDYEEGEIDK